MFTVLPAHARGPRRRRRHALMPALVGTKRAARDGRFVRGGPAAADDRPRLRRSNRITVSFFWMTRMTPSIFSSSIAAIAASSGRPSAARKDEGRSKEMTTPPGPPPPRGRFALQTRPRRPDPSGPILARTPPQGRRSRVRARRGSGDCAGMSAGAEMSAFESHAAANIGHRVG